jgi:hypothetical protein
MIKEFLEYSVLLSQKPFDVEKEVEYPLSFGILS